MRKTETRYIVVVLLLLIIALSSGCAFKNMKPEEGAVTAGYESSDVIKVIGAKYIELIKGTELTVEEKLYLRTKIGPLLDKAADMQLKYNDAVIKWAKNNKQTGIVTPIPADVTAKQSDYTKTLGELMASWTSATTKTKGAK